MEIRVEYFGVLRGHVGAPMETLEVAADCSVEDMLKIVTTRHPRLEELAAGVAVAVDAELCRRSAVLHEGAVVALLPPVSGG